MSRRLIAQRGLKGLDNDLTQRISSSEEVKVSQAQIFYKALVIDTISDPSLPMEEDTPRTENFESLSSVEKKRFMTAPRNSLLCRLIKEGDGVEVDTFVCYPFFSSHVALPAKPGEVVWLMRENMSDPAKQKNYWMTRVAGELGLEDANFTSYTRNIQISHTGSISPEGRKALFPNQTPGLGAEEKFDESLDDPNGLAPYLDKSPESNSVVHEPVPRLTKRPGDLTLQGSNNTAIILGTDREAGTYNLSNRPDKPTNSNASKKIDNNSKIGSIDIVVGRGRYFEPDTDVAKSSRKSAEASGVKNSTQPFIVENSLESKYETDKNPAMTQDVVAISEDEDQPEPGNRLTNPAEGDPDFLVDACRIYAAENTAVDVNLGLDQIIPTKIQGGKFESSSGPSIAVKSDHIRIVARKAPNEKAKADLLPKGFEGVNGTIRIVKEGDASSDLSSIIMEADGTIQISGSKIFLGRATSDGGNGKGPGEGESQPYVRYSDLEKLWQDTMTALDSFCQTLSTHTTPGYGAPSPQITSAAATLKGEIASLKQAITTVKSERIFGE